MVYCIHQQMLKVNKEVACFVGYVALTTNEVTNIDNQNWVSMHGYVVKDCCQIPIMIIVEKILTAPTQIT